MAVLRAHQASALRRFTTPVVTSVEPDAAAPLLARIHLLEAEIEQLSRSLADTQLDAERREDAALAAGRRQAIDDDGARVRAVAAGVAAATQALDDHLAGLEHLAGRLAELSLEKLFGDGTDHRRLVVDMIRAVIARLRATAALHVSVSATDFADASADDLRAALNPVPLAIEGGLKAGEARIGLELGDIDISVDAQWTRLRTFLRSLGEEPS